MLRVRRRHQQRRGSGERLLGEQRLAPGGRAGGGGARGAAAIPLHSASVFQRALDAYFEAPMNEQTAARGEGSAGPGSW